MAPRGLVSAAIAPLLLCAAQPLPAPGPVLRIGSQTQLLIDDYIVQSQTGIETVQMKPSPGQVVLTSDRPWEQRIFYPDVVRTAAGMYRMYYNIGLAADPRRNDIGVAVSRDGRHFEKPTLSAVTIGGLRTNIVLEDGHGPGIVPPSNAGDGGYRLGFGMRGGMGVAVSPDGLRFAAAAGNPVVANKADTKQSILWDPATRRWIWFTRMWEKPQDGRPGWSRFDGDIRSVARFESTDFIHWSKPEVVIRRSAEDPALSDYYGLQVTIRHGVMLGLLWTSDWDDLRGSIGRQRAQLVISRDNGHSWIRVDRRHPFFDLGEKGGFDGEIAWPTSILTVGREDLIYYQGARIEHAVTPVDQFPRDAYALGVRAIGHDRFVARRAGDREGVLITRKFQMPCHGSLHLNLDAGRLGYARAALLDPAQGTVLAASAPLTGNRLDGRVRWTDGKAGSLCGRPVQLKLALRDASLFAFGFH